MRFHTPMLGVGGRQRQRLRRRRWEGEQLLHRVRFRPELQMEPTTANRKRRVPGDGPYSELPVRRDGQQR